MPALSIPNSFTPGTLIQSAQVNANFTAIQTLLNTTKLDSSNIQAGGLTIDRLATTTPNQALYTNGSGVVTTGVLPAIDGGTGAAISLNPSLVGQSLVVNPAGTAFQLGNASNPAANLYLAKRFF